MFTELFQLYDTFITSRANEALMAALYLGPSEWVWFALGLLPIALFVASIRIVQLVPNEQAWQLTMLRLVASWFGYIMLISILVIIIYAYFAHVGGDLAWTVNNRLKFWPFVSQYSRWSFYGSVTGLILGVLAWSIIARKLEPMIASKLHNKTQKTEIEDRLTDARTITNHLPSLTKKKIYFAKVFTHAHRKKSIFLGIDRHGKAVLIPIIKFNKSHIQICGPTGTGKGVQAAIVLIQSLINGDAIFVFDPKCDEWAPSVIAQECQKLDIPFIYINLREPVPQINILKGATADEVFEIFVAGFGLDEKGEAADFYRIDDREAAYQLAQAFDKNRELSLPELYDIANDVLEPELYANAKGFISRLKQLSRIKAIQTRDGVNLKTVLKQGGAIYVVGAMRGQDIPALQKIIALRVIQIIENQKQPDRHAVILLDEIKYLLSSPTVNSFGTIRDKNCSLITTHQALKDLKDCGKDLTPEAVEGAILTNTQIKWIYCTTDPATAEWAAKMTGKILVNKERRVVQRNEFLSETTHSERTLDQVERYTFDENTIMHLPNGCALCIGAGSAQLALAQPIPTIKRSFHVIAAKPITRRIPGQELISEAPAPDLHKDNVEIQGDELL